MTTANDKPDVALLKCDTCGAFYVDDYAALSESCLTPGCGRFKQRMDDATLDEVLRFANTCVAALEGVADVAGFVYDAKSCAGVVERVKNLQGMDVLHWSEVEAADRILAATKGNP